MNVPREATQPLAEDLISYVDYVERLQKLSASPRVRIDRVERSHEGRGIYAIIIADEKVVSNLDYYQSLAAQLEYPQITHSTVGQWQQQPRPAAPDDMRYPVLFVAESFGHEASHVEAMLDVAEQLAWSDNEAIDAILSKLIVVILPMANPDGRESAIDHWKRNRLGEDSSVAGNAYGFYVNRDLLHLTQPEGKAIMRLVREWNPVLVYDAHEDAYVLGVIVPELCWCPAFGNSTTGDIPRNVHDTITRLSRAIIEVWDERGYNYYRDDLFAYPTIGQPPDQPHWFALGNVIGTIGMHGIPAVITESARMLGTQTWKDRLGQKITASMAMLTAMVTMADDTARMMYRNAEELVEAGQDDGFFIPKNGQDPAGLATIVEILIQHKVSIYHLTEPQSGYVVPLAQAKAKIARELLSSESAKLMALPPALGLKVLRLSALADSDRQAYLSATLTPVLEASTPGCHVIGPVTTCSHVAIPNTPDGVRLVNRLWHLGTRIFWLAGSVAVDQVSLTPGTFIVENISFRALETFSRDLYLSLVMIPEGTSILVRTLRKPTVSLYLGQGVDGAEMSWCLERQGFDFIPLYGNQVQREQLQRSDLLIVPDGDPKSIVQGWHRDTQREGMAWDLPGEPDGIGNDGLRAIHDFVNDGGGYIGIGSGGGLLALADYAGLADLTVAHRNLGSARVILRTADLESPLVYGLSGYDTEDGEHHDNKFSALYYTEVMTGDTGGPIFNINDGAQAIAYYHAADADPRIPYVVQPELFGEENGGVAVAYQQFGQGNVTVIGVRPGFRAIWTHSCTLIWNAIFQQVAAEPTVVTLA